MNVQISAAQSNTKRGSIISAAAVDLTNTGVAANNYPTGIGSFGTGAEGRLVKLATVNGVRSVLLPTATTDLAIYVLLTTGLAGALVDLEAPDPGGECRIRAKGTGGCGNLLCLADMVAVPADAGKVRAVPTTAGTYQALFIAEEDFVDGQLVKCRPFATLVTH